jgi:tetratricopeptide (TPR) repeat protein
MDIGGFTGFMQRHPWSFGLIFVFAGLLAYSNTFTSPFHFDDLQNIKESPTAHQLVDEDITLTEAVLESYCTNRPIANVSLLLQYALHGENVMGYHVVNLVIHMAAGLLLYWITKTTLTLPAAGGFKEDEACWLALFSALLWFLHPVQTQSVTYIVQRMNSQAAMFYLLALFLYVRGRLRVMSGRTGWPWFLGCALSGLLALGSKEIAATLPVFLFLYEWFFFQDLKGAWLKRSLPYLLGVLVLVGLAALVYLGPNPKATLLSGYERRDFTPGERVLTQFRVVLYYVSLLVYPHPSRLNLDHDFPVSHSLTEPMTTLFAMGAVVGLLAMAGVLARRHRLLSFAILWFFGNQVIESSVVCLELVFEHRMYLPSMFFFVPLVILTRRLFKDNRIFIGGLTAVAMLFGVWTYQRNIVWADSVSLWADCAKKSPNKLRPQYNLGTNLARRSRLDEASSAFRAALRVKPDDTKSHFNLANVLVHQGRLDEAIHHYQEAIRTRPQYPEAETGIGVALARQGKLDEAIAHYEKALRMHPLDPVTHKNLGFALARQGRYGEGVKHYEEALRLKPDDEEARKNLKMTQALQAGRKELPDHHPEMTREGAPEADALLREGVALAQQGQTEEAVARFRRVLAMAPHHGEAHFNLALALSYQGKLEEAAAQYGAAIQSDPRHWRAHNNLGIIRAKAGALEEAIAHFEAALRINPDFSEARQNLDRARREAGRGGQSR